MKVISKILKRGQLVHLFEGKETDSFRVQELCGCLEMIFIIESLVSLDRLRLSPNPMSKGILVRLIAALVCLRPLERAKSMIQAR